MNEYGSVLQRADLGSTGTSQDIVSVLTAYGRALPIDFLAHVLKRSTVDLQPDLGLLTARHVLESDGETVRLLRETEMPQLRRHRVPA